MLNADVRQSLHFRFSLATAIFGSRGSLLLLRIHFLTVVFYLLQSHLLTLLPIVCGYDSSAQ